MLTTAEIKRFISDDINSEKKKRAAVGQRYYEGEHDIRECRFFYWNADEKLVEDTTRTNNKISHPFFTELSDQLSSYMLSFHDNPIRAKESVDGLQDHLDLYFDEEFWAEISELISGAYNKGFDYIYGYKSKEDRLKFSHADGMGVIEVREKDADDECKHILYWYIDRIDKGKKVVKRIQDWTEKEVVYYVQVGDGKIQKDGSAEINPRPHVVYTDEHGKRMGHPLGYIPFWRLDNNKKQFSGLKPIKGLIDDYDMMQCGLSNNLADFDTPLHVIKGFQGDNLDQLQTNLKTKKLIGVDAEGDVEVRTVDIPYQARQAKANDDEKNIYRFGMGLNTAGLKDTSATTNLAIKAAYALLDMKANKMETRLKRLLKDIIKVVLAEINDANKTAFSPSDVFFDFKRETMANETENIANDKVKAETKQTEVNTILSVAATVGDEQTLKLLCESLDIDFEEIKGQLEELQEGQNAQAAKDALDTVVIE
jgi:SPP1 family phage portal protein